MLVEEGDLLPGMSPVGAAGMERVPLLKLLEKQLRRSSPTSKPGPADDPATPSTSSASSSTHTPTTSSSGERRRQAPRRRQALKNDVAGTPLPIPPSAPLEAHVSEKRRRGKRRAKPGQESPDDDGGGSSSSSSSSSSHSPAISLTSARSSNAFSSFSSRSGFNKHSPHDDGKQPDREKEHYQVRDQHDRRTIFDPSARDKNAHSLPRPPRPTNPHLPTTTLDSFLAGCSIPPPGRLPSGGAAAPAAASAENNKSATIFPLASAGATSVASDSSTPFTSRSTVERRSEINDLIPPEQGIVGKVVATTAPLPSAPAPTKAPDGAPSSSRKSVSASADKKGASATGSSGLQKNTKSGGPARNKNAGEKLLSESGLVKEGIVSKLNGRCRVFAFVNPSSGGNMGEAIIKALIPTIGEENVCDLSAVKPADFVVENVVPMQNVARLLVCGGDGTASWILGVLAGLCDEGKMDFQPPIGVVPLGTGNDLARSLGWGPTFSIVGGGSGVTEYVRMMEEAELTILDQWELTILPKKRLPEDHKLKTLGSHPQLLKDSGQKEPIYKKLRQYSYVTDEDDIPSFAQGLAQFEHDKMHAHERRKKIRENMKKLLDSHRESDGEIFQGTWQNYFSIGTDADTAVFVENARQTSCGRCTFKSGCGKMWYGLGGAKNCKCCARTIPAEADLYVQERLRGENEFEDASLQKRFVQSKNEAGKLRTLVFLNINSYGAGHLPYTGDIGKQRPHDGLVEVLGCRNTYELGLSTVCNAPMATLARGKAFLMDIHTGWYMQSDGEGWYLDNPCLLTISKKRTAVMLRAPVNSKYWNKTHKPTFWPIVLPPSANAANQIRQREEMMLKTRREKMLKTSVSSRTSRGTTRSSGGAAGVEVDDAAAADAAYASDASAADGNPPEKEVILAKQAALLEGIAKEDYGAEMRSKIGHRHLRSKPFEDDDVALQDDVVSNMSETAPIGFVRMGLDDGSVWGGGLAENAVGATRLTEEEAAELASTALREGRHRATPPADSDDLTVNANNQVRTERALSILSPLKSRRRSGSGSQESASPGSPDEDAGRDSNGNG